MPEVSLIIPIYNAREHIKACLDSVLAQTCNDIEAILVDDHGPDDSIAVAQAHLAGYDGPKQFRFVATTANAGPGAARNVGLDVAKGKFIAFLDSDDTLDPAFCEKMLAAAQGHNADLVCCQAVAHCGHTETILHNPVFPAGTLSKKQRKYILGTVVTYLWTYMVRRDFLTENDIRFPAFRSAEDSCFVLSCWLSARRAVSLEEPLYHYTVIENSISRRPDRDRWKQRLGSFRALRDYAIRSGLWCPYRHTLRWVICKKGWLLATRDFLTSRL